VFEVHVDELKTLGGSHIKLLDYFPRVPDVVGLVFGQVLVLGLDPDVVLHLIVYRLFTLLL
jgi:hypothetical protein